MPNFFPEGNTPLPTDSEERSLLKAVSLLQTIASGSGGGGGGGGHSGSTFYELKSANFTAEIGKNYAVDTSSGVVSVTLPSNPQTGEIVGFADAKGTWGTNAITILRNGKYIEGSEIDFSNNASGTFFVVLFIDNSTGWRVLTSGTKPLNLTAPTVSGTYEFTSTNGTWTGSPTSYTYQWQMSTNGTSGWSNINGATSSTYKALEADEGKYVRIGVIATNSNGPSAIVYSNASGQITIPSGPLQFGTALMWFDGSDANSMFNATSGGSVVAADGLISRWEDKSGNGSHAISGDSANPPTRKTNQLNGLDAVYFDGSDDGLTFDVLHSAPLTFFAVWKLITPTEVAPVFGAGPLFYRHSGGFRIYNGDDLTGAPVSTDQWTLATCVVNGASSSISINQGSPTTGNAGSSNNMRGIGYWADGSQYPQQYIAEVILYDGVLSSGAIADVENYLISKWGLGI